MLPGVERSEEVLDTLFLVCAVAGGAVFALRTLLMLLGIGDDHVIHHEGDASGDGDAGARLLSIQGVSAFLMMFGLVGLALLRQSGFPSVIAMTLALAAGLGSMWGIAQVFRLMRRLQSSGTLDLRRAIGKEGVVYLTVRPGQGGQVQLTVQGRLGVFEARAEGEREIATGQNVRVTDVRAGLLVVEPIQTG
jgi:membrane protein implicated in regulation of membrane protease activity